MEDTNIKNIFKITGIFSILMFAVGILELSLKSVQVETSELTDNSHQMIVYMRNSNMPNIYHLNKK